MSHRPPTSLYLFRRDLRLGDNPALLKALEKGPTLAVYVQDDEGAGPFKMGAASKCWLHHSLDSLYAAMGESLNFYVGPTQEIIHNLLARFPSITSIYWNRSYEPWRIAQDKTIKKDLLQRGYDVESHNASLLWEPWQILTKSGTPYQVFTPYYTKGCLGAPAPRLPLLTHPSPTFVKDPQSLKLADLTLMPDLEWGRRMMTYWQVGEAAARIRLDTFCEDALSAYGRDRDFPSIEGTSSLSPHLAFGETSPQQIWWYVQERAAPNLYSTQGHETFLKELAWREFSYYLLYHFPDLPVRNYQRKFDAFHWGEDDTLLEAWQKGLTGYPLVDAGMRQLWQTGTMHNRVRMVVASFLVKNLGLHWRLGAQWFWDCLVDADLASNSASWQWVAGCGADAAPYYRIFNPITQGEKFDPDGRYTRRFVPELASLPQKYLFTPALAPSAVLNTAGIVLGETYPRPLVDIKVSREKALMAYAALSNKI